MHKVKQNMPAYSKSNETFLFENYSIDRLIEREREQNRIYFDDDKRSSNNGNEKNGIYKIIRPNPLTQRQ